VRGNPIKEWIIFSAIWLMLLIPVIKLTGFRKAEEPSTGSQLLNETAQNITATALMRYTGRPIYFKLTQNGKTLCDIKDPPPDETEEEISLAIEENSAELLLQVKWPDETQHAFEIELIVDGEQEQKVHCWAESELDEIVTFNWQSARSARRVN
jgi:hypothetical protein